ncbi:MAG: glycoside hydrolase family 104 protein [Comamonas sp.]|uniref:glycoside hydrolase family 24 protein n=1 Tax=Comamonas sp. TaxID=34028 RepID=UPI00284C62FB|nr:glycoside hydrolase family 104 protein [Comamonas sp.]MDR3067724.1 glycoside hydrolase family 104 protein [Comamonas sp.]
MNQQNSINTVEQLSQALGNTNAQMYLRMLQQAEGTYRGADSNPYATAFGGGQLPDLRQHPRTLHSFTQTDGKPNKTSAAGAYQFLGSTWDDVAGKLGLQDFGPRSQDLAALELMRRNGSLPDVLAGNFGSAVKKDGRTWASLPSSPYAQPKRSQGFVERALDAVIPSAGAAELPQQSGPDARRAFEQAMQQYRTQYGGQGRNVSAAAATPAQQQPPTHAQPGHQSNPSGADPRAAFEAAMRDYKAKTPAPAAPQERSTMDAIGRQVGLAGRYALEGTGQLADIFTTPVRDFITDPLVRLVSGPEKTSMGDLVKGTRPAPRQSKSTSQIASSVADWMGLPKPEGELENVVGTATRAVAGAGGAAGAAGALATKAANATTQAVLNWMGSRPLAQLASAATGGASSEIARQNGAGIGGQMVAGVLGAMAPGAVSATRQAVQQATRGPVMPEMHRQAVKDAIEAGYKLPPSQAKPSTVNRVLDGALDRAKLNAELTLSNQQASNNLARRAVGLPEGAELSRQSLANLRQQAGQSYETLRNLGPITPDKAFRTELRDIGKQYANTKNSFPGLVADNGVAKIVKGANVKTMDSSSAVDAIRTLRERAGDLFAAGNQTAGRAARKTATAIENQLERHLQGTGNEAAVQAFRDARQQIARVHELERVLTPSGNIDAKALGAALKRGKPLTGDMLSIAQAGRTFPTVMRTPEVVGSVPSLGFFDAVVPATLGATTGNVGAMGLILARPAMRGLLSSNRMQQSLLSPVTPVAPGIGFQPGLLSAPISAAGAR